MLDPEMTAWVAANLASSSPSAPGSTGSTGSSGLPPVEAPVVVADTPRSLVVRFEGGDPPARAYFKADRILPPPEATILARLAKRWPQRVAPLVAVDEERGWTLTRDAGVTGLDGASTDAWCRVTRSFGEVQLDSGLGGDDWLALGCRDLRDDKLHQAIVEMLEDTRPRLAPEVSSRLQELEPRVAAACAALATDEVSATLVHQDLVPVNIIATGIDGEPVFLDWSDTVVGHPFFGCDRLLDFCWTEPERKAAVIDAYLEPFHDLASPESLRESFQHVLWLRVLYECVRWHHEIAAMNEGGEHAELLRRDMVAGLTAMARHAK